MRRVLLTVLGLLLALAALLAVTIRVLDCADCGGAPEARCGRCRGVGRITLLNRVLRSPPDAEVFRLLNCKHAHLESASQVSDDALRRLLRRWGREVSWLYYGEAFWTDPEVAAVVVPASSPHGCRIFLVGRDGSFRDEVRLEVDFLSEALRVRFDGSSFHVTLAYLVPDLGPDRPPRTLRMQGEGWQRRFRVPPSELPAETLLLRVGIDGGRLSVQGLGDGLKELAAGAP